MRATPVRSTPISGTSATPPSGNTPTASPLASAWCSADAASRFMVVMSSPSARILRTSRARATGTTPNPRYTHRATGLVAAEIVAT
jgi:hypothetical protein